MVLWKTGDEISRIINSWLALLDFVEIGYIRGSISSSEVRERERKRLRAASSGNASLNVTFLVFSSSMVCRRGIAMRILSVGPSVRLSVCPSVWRTRGLWQNERKISPNFYTIRMIIYPSFLTRRMICGEATPSTWNFASNGPRWSEIADFQAIFARSASAVTTSEKISINTNIGSPQRAFQWA